MFKDVLSIWSASQFRLFPCLFGSLPLHILEDNFITGLPFYLHVLLIIGHRILSVITSKDRFRGVNESIKQLVREYFHSKNIQT
jgi:hypothetical protein